MQHHSRKIYLIAMLMVFFATVDLSAESRKDYLGLLNVSFEAGRVPVFNAPNEPDSRFAELLTAGVVFTRSNKSCDWVDDRALGLTKSACTYVSYFQREGIALRVFQIRNGNWYQVSLSKNNEIRGWVQADKFLYHTIEYLLKDPQKEVLSFSEDWNGRLYKSAKGELAEVIEKGKRGTWVNVLSVERVNDLLWLKIQIMDKSRCLGTDKSTSLSEGWIPFTEADTGQNVNFSDHDCEGLEFE